MSNFIPTDRKTDYLLPPSVDDWLTQDHLARFVVEVIDGLDLSNLTRQYAGRGSKAHHPATLLALLLYGYSTGVFSSRKLEMATEMKLLKLGTVCLDDTKIHANASRHSALSHGHIVKLEAQLRQEVQALLALAEDADTANIPDGMSLPKELKLREDRLAAMAKAKAKIAARAAERYAREKAEFDEKMDRRQAKAKATGKKPGGKPPAEPEPGVKESDQINLTDEESRIMPVAGGGFEQCYNAQAGVDAHTMLVVAATLTQAPNDKQQVQPMIKVLQEQAPKLGTVTTVIADTGYCSENNVVACEGAKIVPLIAVARQDHHPHWSERFAQPEPLQENATPMQAMAHRLTTKAGRAAYALRKQTVEPVFGIIKSVMGFRQFSLRGLRKVTGEWHLVCMNIDPLELRLSTSSLQVLCSVFVEVCRRRRSVFPHSLDPSLKLV